MNIKQETTWSGEYVSEKLNIEIKNRDYQILNIEDVVGLSLRNNPKRAHLLVSKILGKHIPASPSLILAAGQILGGMAYEALGGDMWPMEDVFESMDKVMKGSERSAITMAPPVKKMEAVTIGYAETATSLGYIVAQFLQSPYIHSTRYGKKGKKAYGAFEEAHSHATSHKLMPSKKSFLHNNLPLVLVDDEMSTGKTIMATIEELHSLSPRKHYVVCSLIDCRTAKDKAIMDDFAARLGIQLNVVAISHGEVSYPETILEDVKPVLSHLDKVAEKDAETKLLNTRNPVTIEILKNLPFPDFKHARYGVKDLTIDEKIAASLIPVDEDKFLGRVLVLGTEEFMFLPLMAAWSLEKQGENVFSSSTTRSPVMPHSSAEYAIRTKLTYSLPDGDERYLYNADGFDIVVIIVEPGNDYRDFFVDNGLIQALETTSTSKIIIIQGDTHVR